MLTNTTANIIADLDNYLAYRADQEGGHYDLTPDYFEQMYAKGQRNFFGVDVGNSNLLRDTQAPGIYAAWRVLNPVRDTSASGFLPRDTKPSLIERIFNCFKRLGN